MPGNIIIGFNIRQIIVIHPVISHWPPFGLGIYIDIDIDFNLGLNLITYYKTG
jgi:hypothetical protein